jgi:hypothetical protein
MSFFTDLFEGNFGNLGNDITHAPSSLASHPDQLAETLGVVGLGVGGALGLGALAGDAGLFGAGAADAAAAAAPADALAFAPAADALAPAAADTAGIFGGADLSSGVGLGTAAADVGTGATTDVAAATPTFASTDAELAGGAVGTAPAGTSTAAPAASSSGGGITGALGDAMKSPWTRLALAGAPLATSLAFGSPGLPSQLGPAQANAAALAAQGSALNPSQTASLQQMRQDAINAARQALFNQGVKDVNSDTRYSQMVSNIDSQVTAAAQTMIQQNIANSLAGDAQLIQIAQLQMQSDQNFVNNLLNATKALGTAFGLGGGITLKVA